MRSVRPPCEFDLGGVREYEKEEPGVTGPSSSAMWVGLLVLSVAADAGATAYLKVFGDRVDGFGFFWAAVAGVVAFAPSIVLFGYALKSGPSYFATVGLWAVGVCAINALVGLAAFGDSFSVRTALGIVCGCLTVALLKPA
jgi:multidrug transporter EmrE-like cation transporter